MKVEIVQIADRGRPSQERIHLRVLAPTDLQYYVLSDTTYSSANAISNKLRHTFWFPPHPVRAGDNVVLITGTGIPVQRANSAGGTDHFFYWNLQQTVWNNNGDCAVLFEIDSWTTSRYE